MIEERISNSFIQACTYSVNVLYWGNVNMFAINFIIVLSICFCIQALFIILNISVIFCQSDVNLNNSEYDKVIYLNVGGELMFTTYSTLTYVPNTKLSLLNAWPRDNEGTVFLDLPADLFKHFLRQLRRWSIRGNQSMNTMFESPSWKVKDEFNEMLVKLGFKKYQQGILVFLD